MKVAVVYNRDSANVINLFGLPNRETIGRKTIDRLLRALKSNGHQAIALEGDKDLIDRLEEFMPRVVQGERPGLVFNVSYGIQGQARYTHVPSILEMVGVPYVASGPLAHSLALDKVVTKMILRQHGLPTPDFALLQTPDVPIPDLRYPLIVKPRSEAVSFGLKVVHDEEELRTAAGAIYEEYRQGVLAEQYIEGREINVGILGNDPPEAFPPVQLDFGTEGPAIYTYEDKTGRSGRQISPICPAPIGEELTLYAQQIATGAFAALGCSDCARVDMRLDDRGDFYILEVNSLPSLGEHGSYLVGAAEVGLDFTGFIGRLIEVASARYFGTPQPPRLGGSPSEPSTTAFQYVVERRDRMERDLREWTSLHSRTDDLVGLQQATKRVETTLRELALRPVPDLCSEHTVLTWETVKGLTGGMLFIANLDVPIDVDFPPQPYRRDPEWLHGEGVGSSRGPLLMLEYALTFTSQHAPAQASAPRRAAVRGRGSSRPLQRADHPRGGRTGQRGVRPSSRQRRGPRDHPASGATPFSLPSSRRAHASRPLFAQGRRASVGLDEARGDRPAHRPDPADIGIDRRATYGADADAPAPSSDGDHRAHLPQCGGRRGPREEDPLHPGQEGPEVGIGACLRIGRPLRSGRRASNSSRNSAGSPRLGRSRSTPSPRCGPLWPA